MVFNFHENNGCAMKYHEIFITAGPAASACEFNRYK